MTEVKKELPDENWTTIEDILEQEKKDEEENEYYKKMAEAEKKKEEDRIERAEKEK